MAAVREPPYGRRGEANGRLDRCELVVLLEKHPASLIDDTAQHHPSHADTVTWVTGLFTQPPVPHGPK